MKTARENLFSYKKIYDQVGSEELFVEAMRESILHHSANCEFYGNLLKVKGFKAEDIKTLKLNKRSVVLTGGGWKKFDDMAIDK